MKPVKTVLLALLTLSASCVKEKQKPIPDTPGTTIEQEPAPKQYRLNTIQETDAGNRTVTKTFKYNGFGYLVEYKIVSPPNNGSPDEYVHTVTFERDKQNNIVKEGIQNPYTGNMTGTYEYVGGKVSVINYKYADGTNTPAREVRFSWKDEHPFSRTNFAAGEPIPYIENTVEFDGMHNVIATRQKVNGTFTDIADYKQYDDKKTPYRTLKDITAVVQTAGMNASALSANNPVSYESISGGVTLQYTYNDAGLPVKIVEEDGTVTTFEYTEL